MKHFISRALFIGAFFISASLAAIDPAVQNQIKQKIQSLEQQKLEIKKVIESGSQDENFHQELDEKIKQPCGDFCQWRTKEFYMLEGHFKSSKNPAFHNTQYQLSMIAHTIESEVNELIVLLKKGGYKPIQLDALQDSLKSMHNFNVTGQKSISIIKDKAQQIDRLESVRKELENQYNTYKDARVKIKIGNTYDSLHKMLNDYFQNNDHFFGALNVEREMNYVLKMTQEILQKDN